MDVYTHQPHRAKEMIDANATSKCSHAGKNTQKNPNTVCQTVGYIYC